MTSRRGDGKRNKRFYLSAQDQGGAGKHLNTAAYTEEEDSKAESASFHTGKTISEAPGRVNRVEFKEAKRQTTRAEAKTSACNSRPGPHGPGCGGSTPPSCRACAANLDSKVPACRSTYRHDFQAFGLGKLCLPPVRGQEQFALERERGGHVKQVNGSRSQTFRMSRGKLRGTGDGGIHVQSHIEQRATGHASFETSEGGITLPRNVLALPRGDRASLVDLPPVAGTGMACAGRGSAYGKSMRAKRSRSSPAAMGRRRKRYAYSWHGIRNASWGHAPQLSSPPTPCCRRSRLRVT